MWRKRHPFSLGKRETAACGEVKPQGLREKTPTENPGPPSMDEG